MDTLLSGIKDMDQPVWPLKLAIVGGGKPCKFFLELSRKDPFPNLNIQFIAVWDANPNAVGMELAREMGILTTTRLRDIFEIEGLSGIVELTNDRDTLLELIRLRPKGLGIIEHNLGWFIRQFYNMSRQLKREQDKVMLEKMSSDFLIQQSDAAVVILDTDYTIVEANEAYLKAVNQEKKDVIGARCHVISHGIPTPCKDARAHVSCPMEETLKTGRAAHVIHEHPTTAGHSKFCNMVTYPLKGSDDKILRIIEIWRDITDQLSFSWERRLEVLKHDTKRVIQEDRMISLGKLVASCVHEINNPIQGLLTFSHLMMDILEEKTPDADDLQRFKHHLKLMASELERCGRIVSGLLSFSRAGGGESRPVDINAVLQDVIALTTHKMTLSNIRLKTELAPVPLMILGDTNQLQQCFLNLVFNAIEAMPTGGSLSITSTASDEGHEVRIQDTGMGVAEEDLDSIFDPFFTTKPPGQGTGLGLSIVYGVVQDHGGQITVESRLREGTMFCLIFPGG